MTKVFAILVSALLMISTPASAGVNKTNDAFSEDISLTRISQVTEPFDAVFARF